MLIGDIFYYDKSGRRLAHYDPGQTAVYAERASTDHEGTVEWRCRNGDPRDIRLFESGRQIPGRTVRVVIRRIYSGTTLVLEAGDRVEVGSEAGNRAFLIAYCYMKRAADGWKPLGPHATVQKDCVGDP